MKVLNFIWGFALGAGIDKCFLTYTRLGEVDPELEVKSVCIRLGNLNAHTEQLNKTGVGFIDIKSRKDLSWIRKLSNLIKEYNPDVVFTHGFNGAIIMLILRIFKGTKVKCVFTYHGTYTAPSSWYRKLLAPVFNYLPVWIYEHLSAKTICVSNNTKKQLLECGVSDYKLSVVFNGLPSTEEMGSIDGIIHPAILSASRIDTVKGLDYLVNALAILKERNVDFHYYAVGEGPELDNLKQLVANSALSDDIEFVGFQSNVGKWLSSVDIFALPSLKEYHSIGLLEAMRAGKAIVASNVGGNPESIRAGIDGLLVPAKDPVALADALERMITDKDLRERCSESARKRFEESFTEEAMMKNIVKVLREAVNQES